ncbi:hypothetical protein CTA1_11550 [Colletotrichum tanaceti]|uniref:Uncharacterized protein n=1 Tax=Colletotrichum tanaceti TaxID=1306861 RepID=A0A4U6XH73_9PEZI|nr:hypothetical protein CTA1_11550 [Colletotrichum tanaceti]
MPPKKNIASEGQGSGTANFTENEVTFVKAVFDSMNSRPDVDFDKVANIMSLANAKCAKDRFRIISKKHGWSSTAGAGGASPSKGALGAKNTAKVMKTPTKKKGVAQKKKNTKKESSSESDNDDDVASKLESDSDGQKAAKDELMQEDSSDSE